MYASIYASFVKKHLPLALQGIALAVLLGWVSDAHVPGLSEPIVPNLQVPPSQVKVTPRRAPETPKNAQVLENKTEIKSFKEQVEAAKARQWKQTADRVTQAVVSLTQGSEPPANEVSVPPDKVPELFSAIENPKINEPPDLIQRPNPPELTSIVEQQQLLPLSGSELPLAVPDIAIDSPLTPPDTPATWVTAVEETFDLLKEAASKLVESAQEGLEQFTEAAKDAVNETIETAKDVVNETAAAASPGVSHVADAVAAEMVPTEVTPLEIAAVEEGSDAPSVVDCVTGMSANECPVVLPNDSNIESLSASQTSSEAESWSNPEVVPNAVPPTPAPVPSATTAESLPANPISIEPKAEVLATAPASSQAETAAPLYPKVGLPKPKTEVPAEEPASVVLKEIRFKGAKYFSNESLQAMVAKFLGIPLQYNDMLDIAYAVENFYKKNNHLARVMLTQQDVTEGVLTLDVIESKLSKVTVDQQLSALPSTQEHILALIEQQHPKGDTFNAQHVDRALALANEVPGVSVAGALNEGGELGETELILKLYQNHGRQAELVVDNLGSRATGAERVMGNATFLNPGDLGDSLSLSTIVTRGSEYLRAAYSLPIGLDGWRLGLNGSAMDYKVVVGDQGVVDNVGKAFTQGLELIYPLDRSPETSSTFSLTAEAKQFKNVMSSGQVMTDYDAEVLVAQFSGVDRAFTKTSGVFNYSLQFSHGVIDLHDSGMTNRNTDLNKINGDFNKLRTTLTFIEPWTAKTDVYVAFNGQLADKNLDSSEKFQLGGAMGVRAYPTGEGSGSDGKMLNFELRHRFDNGVSLTGFYDWGSVDDLHTPNPYASNSVNSYDLKGFGLSAGYTFRNGVTAKATWATRDGDNPNPKIPSGTDQDGSRDRNRFWLQMTVPF
jgi:hemolysin activation/secretion protein